MVEEEVAEGGTVGEQGQAVLQHLAGPLDVQLGDHLAERVPLSQVQLLQLPQLGHRHQQGGHGTPAHMHLRAMQCGHTAKLPAKLWPRRSSHSCPSWATDTSRVGIALQLTGATTNVLPKLSGLEQWRNEFEHERI